MKRNETYQTTSPFLTEHTYPGYRSLLVRLVSSTKATSTSVLIVSVIPQCACQLFDGQSLSLITRREHRMCVDTVKEMM